MLSKKSGCYLEFWTRISVAFSSSLLARSHGDEPSPSTALCTELVFMADGHNHPTTDHREAESGLISNMTRKSWLTLDHSHSSNPAGLAFAKAFTALYDTFLQKVFYSPFGPVISKRYSGMTFGTLVRKFTKGFLAKVFRASLILACIWKSPRKNAYIFLVIKDIGNM